MLHNFYSFLPSSVEFSDYYKTFICSSFNSLSLSLFLLSTLLFSSHLLAFIFLLYIIFPSPYILFFLHYSYSFLFFTLSSFLFSVLFFFSQLFSSLLISSLGTDLFTTKHEEGLRSRGNLGGGKTGELKWTNID